MLAAIGCMMFGLTLAQAADTQTAATSECAVHYTRTACPGQEATSYKKCGGTQSCVKQKKASTMEACQARAVKSCGNRRLNITKSKVITAKWQGKAIKSKSGNDDFCKDYAKRAQEFNRCDGK
jgi:hypothetical protein